MSQLRNVGPIFNIVAGQTVTWSISYGAGQDAGTVLVTLCRSSAITSST